MKGETGFWSGMPTGMKARLIAWLVYFLIAAGVFTQSPILGTFLLVLPILWTVFLLWLSGEAAYGFGPLSGRKDTVLGYTLRYLWNASVYARVALCIAGIVLVVGGLGWFSTENLRAEAAKPSLSERAATLAENATESTKNTASGWVSTAKGWFTADPEE